MSEQAPRIDDQMIDVHSLLQANNAARRELRIQAELDTKTARQEGWVGDQSTEGKPDQELAAQANTLLSYADYAKKGPQSDAEVTQARADHFEQAGGEKTENKGAYELMADYARALVHDDRTLKQDVIEEVHRRGSTKSGEEQVEYLKAYDKRFTSVMDKLSKTDSPEALLASYDEKAQLARLRRQVRAAASASTEPESKRATEPVSEPVAKAEDEPAVTTLPPERPVASETPTPASAPKVAEQPPVETGIQEPIARQAAPQEPIQIEHEATESYEPSEEISFDEASLQANQQTKEAATPAGESERSPWKRFKGVGKRALQRFRDAGYSLPDNYGDEGFARPSMFVRAKSFGKPGADALVAGARSLAQDSSLREEQARMDAVLRGDETLRLVRPDDPASPELSERAYEKRLRQMTRAYIQEQRQAGVLEFDPAEYTAKRAEAEDEAGAKAKKRRSLGRVALARRQRNEQQRTSDRRPEGNPDPDSIHDLLS